MLGETSTRRNFGAWNLISPRLGKLKLLARRPQSFQSRTLSHNTHKPVAIPVVNIDRASIADAGGAVEAKAMAADIVEVIVLGFVLNDRKPSIYYSGLRALHDFLLRRTIKFTGHEYCVTLSAKDDTYSIGTVAYEIRAETLD